MCSADLPYTTSESSLQKEFSNFGQIAEGKWSQEFSVIYTSCISSTMIRYLSPLAVKLIQDGATNRSKGYAFIQYTCQEDAMLALENMDYKVLTLPHPFYSFKIYQSHVAHVILSSELWWQGHICRAGKAWAWRSWKISNNLWTTRGASFSGPRWRARLLVLTRLLGSKEEEWKGKKSGKVTK